MCVFCGRNVRFGVSSCVPSFYRPYFRFWKYMYRCEPEVISKTEASSHHVGLIRTEEGLLMSCPVQRRAFQHDPGTRTRWNPFGWRCWRQGAGSRTLPKSLDTSQSGQVQKFANYVCQRTDRPTGRNLLTERKKKIKRKNERCAEYFGLESCFVTCKGSVALAAGWLGK